MKIEQLSGPELAEQMAQVHYQNKILNRLIDTVPSIIFAFNMEGRITHANQYALDFYGYTEEEMVGLVFMENFIPKRLIEYTLERFAELMAGDTNEDYYIENWTCLKDKSERFVSWNSSYLFNDENEIYGTISVGTDITEKSRTNERNFIIKEFAKATLKITDRISLYNAALSAFSQFTNCHFSIAFEKIENPESNDINTFRFATCFEQDAAFLKHPISEKLKKSPPSFDLSNKEIQELRDLPWVEELTKDSNSALKKLLLKGGYTKSLNIFINEEDKAVSLIRFYFKTTGNENLLGHMALLDEIVNHINLYLQNEASQRYLKQAKHDAEIASRAKSAFLANMSHEIKTPMNAILGHTQLILNRDFSEKQLLESAEIINRSGNHLLHLIDDVMNMTQIEQGVVHLRNSTIEVLGVVKEVFTMLELDAKKKGLNMIWESDANFPEFIETDVQKFKQILINILSNAIKFTNQGSILVHCKSNDNKYINITVSDTGLGISPKDLKLIFDTFSQGSSGKEKGGTGLGLSICKNFAKIMGGDILVQSRLNKGSKFILKLPIRISGEEALLSTDKNKAQPIGYRANIENKRFIKILIADDRAENRKLLSELLIALDFDIKLAKDGKEAVYICEKWNPDLIIMDIAMPVMDGIKATQLIRKKLKNTSVTIIASSASISKKDMTQIMKSGVNGFLPKPFSHEKLYETLKNYQDIEFLYESKTQIKKDKSKEKETIKEIKKLSASIRKKLIKAMDEGDLHEAERIALSIQDKFPQASNYLINKVEAMDLEKIQQIIK